MRCIPVTLALSDSTWLLRTVAAIGFLIAATCAGLATVALRRLGERRAATSWSVVMVLMLAMTVVARLGLQATVADRLRSDATAGGWYGGRRHLQVAVIATTMILGALVAILLVRRLRYLGHLVAPAVAVTIGIIAYELTWPVSLHEVDAVLYGRSGWHLRAVELFGAATVAALGCITALRARPPEGAVVR